MALCIRKVNKCVNNLSPFYHSQYIYLTGNKKLNLMNMSICKKKTSVVRRYFDDLGTLEWS